MQLPYIALLDVKSVYRTSNFLLKVRCVTSHLYQSFFCLKSVRSCESNVPSSPDDSRGVPDGSGVKYSIVDYIHTCVGGMRFILILHTW